jgi:hypothetical protein
MSARLLRVLVIDDEPIEMTNEQLGDDRRYAEALLGTSDLQVVRTPRYRMPQQAWHFGTWEDNIEFWRDPAAYHRPDLAIIDCNFHHDQDAPRIARPRSRTETAQVPADARGLLYGAVHVARMLGIAPWAPFGFVVYSQDLAAFQRDALAVTCFGLLEAMTGRLPAYDERRSLIETLRNRMEEGRWFRGGHPAKAWPVALTMFRMHLADAFENLSAFPDHASFEAARRALERVRDAREPPDPEATIKWLTPLGEEEILTRSLFADLRHLEQWQPDRVTPEILAWIEDAISSDRTRDIVREVMAWMGRYMAGRPGPVLTSRGKTRRRQALAMVMVWAYERTKRRGREPEPRGLRLFETALGIDNRQMERALVDGFNLEGPGPAGAKWTPRTFFNYLEQLPAGSWPSPLPPWVQQAVRHFLANTVKAAPSTWPACFQPAPA